MRRGQIASRLALAAAVAGLAAGCAPGPTAPVPPPDGGSRYVLDFAVFAAQVDTILTARGCDNLSCHGGGIRGTYLLSPATDNDIDLDFEQSSLQVRGSDPASSPLLQKPLAEAAGGSAHAGSAQSGFASTGDPDYQAILAWIEGGAFE